MSKKLLAVIDMQNDFITGALGNAQCRAVVSNVVKKVNHTDADIVYTLDTHGEDYPDTQEGRKLPVKHCIKGTPGWELIPELEHIQEKTHFEKNTFGSTLSVFCICIFIIDSIVIFSNILRHICF